MTKMSIFLRIVVFLLLVSIHAISGISVEVIDSNLMFINDVNGARIGTINPFPPPN